MDISVKELKERQNNSEKLFVIDVREEWEFEESKIDDTINISLYILPQKCKELTNPKDSELIVYCRTGVRGNTAKTVLEQEGFSNVRNLEGGIVAYQE